jgi:DNA/RNA endonuclease YhcR with UshA esterase domain
VQHRIIQGVLCGAALAVFSAAHTGHAIESIDVSVAPLYIGREVIVEGTITSAERDANIVRLQMGPPGRGLIVALVIPLLNDFPPAPETYYTGKLIRAAGLISSYRGKPELAVRGAEDISVVGETRKPAVDTGAQEEAAALRQKVRDLELRVKELENGNSATPSH